MREVEAKGAIVDLGGGIDGYLRASELARDRVEDARMLLKVGDEIEAKFTAVDRKVRTVAKRCRAIAPIPRPAPVSATCSRSRSPVKTTSRPARTRGGFTAAAESRRRFDTKKTRGAFEWTASAA